MRDLVLAHCWTGRPEDGWYPWFQTAASEIGIRVHVPSLPDTDSPVPDRWLETFGRAVKRAGLAPILAGHSLGVATVLHYLAAAEPEQRFSGILMVAGFAEPLGVPAIDPFHAAGFEWERLLARPEPAVLLLGDTDPYLDGRVLDTAARFNAGMGADAWIVAGAAHFSPASGCTELPQAIAACHYFLERENSQHDTRKSSPVPC